MPYLYDDNFAKSRFIILPRKCIHCGNWFFWIEVFVHIYNGDVICTPCRQQKYLTEPLDYVKAYESKKGVLAKQIKTLKEELAKKKEGENYKTSIGN